MKERSKKVRTWISVSAGVGFVAAALVTGRFSFTILGAAALCVAAVMWTKEKIQVKGKEKKKSKKKVNEFLSIVESLRRELEEMKRVCEDLQRKSVGADSGNIGRLRDDINKLLDTTAKRQSSARLGCVTEVCGQCQEAVRELKQRERNLNEFR